MGKGAVVATVEFGAGGIHRGFERQEGEQVAAAFLEKRSDYAIAEEHRLLPGLHEAEGGADSFFIARFTRLGAE